MNICAFILKTATEHQLKNITSDSFISLKLTVGISFGKSFSTVQKPEGKVIFLNNLGIVLKKDVVDDCSGRCCG